MMENRVLSYIATVFIVLSGGLAYSQGDECIDAEEITPTLTDCSYQAGSSGNATESISSCSGGGNSDDDVWYFFVANSTDMEITINPTVDYDAVIELFSGACGTLSSINCQDVNGLNGIETLHASGLTVGNTYFFRVYHYGSGSGTSTFQVCVKGLAPPTNNEPCSAFGLPEVTPSCNYLTYTNLGSAGSSVATPSGCGGSSPFEGGYAGGDVWFSVVVPASGQLDIHTASVDFADGAMALYSGACGSPVLVACDDDGEPGDGILMPHIYQTGLTPGTTMFIRVWEYGNDNNGKFEICVTSPDNDDCASAQQICDLNGYGGVTSSAYTIDTPDNMCGIGDPISPTPGCVFGTGYTGTSPVQIDNNSWLQFTASETTAELFVEIGSCQNGNGMQMQIFEGTNCSNFTAVSNFLETTTSQSVLATGLTIGNVYYIVVDGFAGDICSYTISATSGIQVVEAIAIDKFLCPGESTDINAQVTGTGSYTFSWSSDPVGFSSTTPLITVSPSENTQYTVEVQGYCGTTTSASTYITINDVPVANAGSDQTTCENESTTINGSADGGYAPYTYSWDIPASGASQTVSPNSDTTYTLEVTDANGCKDTAEVLVNVNPTPSILASEDETICFGESATISANGTGIVSYNWTDSESNNYSGQDQTVQAGSTLTFYVTGTDANNCSATDSLLITVHPLPQIDTTSVQILNENCSNNGGSINGISVNGNPVFTYLWNDGLNNVGTTLLIDELLEGTYTLMVTDGNGCENSTEFFVGYTDLSTVAANNDSASTYPNTLVNINGYLNDTGDVGTITIIDYPINGVANYISSGEFEYAPNIGFIGEDSLIYEICDLTCINECERATIYFTVEGEQDVVIPNGFTPNGDGFNDTFVILNLEQYPDNSIAIFSRWGDQIFEAAPYLNDWDGSSKNAKMKIMGDQVVDGTYFFVLDLGNGEEPINGFIDLRRK
ncbi:MAG: gliding motility-associated C-terminal domain-containing protein [Crocinitomicaceae bacterium]